MSLASNVPYKVLLPPRIVEVEKVDIKEFNRLVEGYMQRYPHYVVIGVKDGFALCERIQVKEGS
jgi:hypothetical protein